MRGPCKGEAPWVPYSQPVPHQHFDEEAPGLPAQAQERGLLEGHVVVSDVHQCRPIIFPNEWGDSRQAAGVERAAVRWGQGPGAEAGGSTGGGHGGGPLNLGRILQILACPTAPHPPLEWVGGSTALRPGQPGILGLCPRGPVLSLLQPWQRGGEESVLRGHGPGAWASHF